MGGFALLQGVAPPPVEDPVTQYSKVATLGNLMQERQLRQAQMQEYQVQADQRKRDLADQDTIQTLMADPDVAAKIHTGDMSPFEGKVQEKTIAPIRAAQIASETALLQNGLSKNTLQLDGFNQVASAINGLKNLKNPDGTLDLNGVNKALPGTISTLASSGALKNIGADPSKMQISITDPAQLDQLAVSVGANQALREKVVAQQKGEQEVEKEKALAADAQANAAKTNLIVGLLKTGNAPISGDDIKKLVSLRIDPNKYPDAAAHAVAHAQSAYDGANPETPNAGKKAIADAINDTFDKEVLSVQQANNPMLQSAKAKQAGLDAAATVGPDVQKAVQVEIAKSKLAPGYLAGIQDPSLQHQIAHDYTAANVEYQGKVADAQRLLNLVQAAKSGNQAAASMLNTAEVREIVNRVSTPELQAAGGGSVGRRVSNWVSTAGTGAPSKETLGDLEQFANLGLNAAKVGFGGKVMGFNAQGAKIPLEPPAMPGVGTPASTTPKYNKGDKVMYQGKEHTVTDIQNGKLILSP